MPLSLNVNLKKLLLSQTAAFIVSPSTTLMTLARNILKFNENSGTSYKFLS